MSMVAVASAQARPRLNSLLIATLSAPAWAVTKMPTVPEPPISAPVPTTTLAVADRWTHLNGSDSNVWIFSAIFGRTLLTIAAPGGATSSPNERSSA